MRQYKISVVASIVGLVAASAQAETVQGARSELDRLAAHVRTRPTDYEQTYAYIRLATELHEEAAIGALERLLMYNPSLGRARKELGFLYARIGAYQSAAFNLRAALKSADLDATQKAQIEAQIPDIERQTRASRFSGNLQIGVRTQSNAAYLPSGGLYDVGGVQTFGGVTGRQSDVNAFEQAQIAHDYDFQNQRGDVLETRGLAYATQQFALSQYNVALFSLSVGPRFGLSEIAPGLSVRPHVSGSASLVGNLNYLNTGGAGVGFRQMIGDRLSLEPGFEWSRLWVNSGSGPGSSAQTVATIASGDVFTGSLGVSLRIFDHVRLEGRGAYSRAAAYVAAQASDQFDLQAMLRFEVDPPLSEMPRRWTFAPYARFRQIAFDIANPALDPSRMRRDDAWTYGLALDAPITAQLGVSGHLEFLRNDSNISSFKMHNVSLTFGPTAKF
ncbi:tetratricopeptide repeat protein [Methylosinus sp. RM1]|uniref:tetratricopeptide repeat protein n=1 Tax=Methylosinus sp. RM1 TaxID=2583817 RepID=UPI00351A3630